MRGATLPGRVVAPPLAPAMLPGLLLVGALAACALLAPAIAPYDPAGIDLPSALQPPSAAHRLGTDQLGRDLLSRMLYGARISLSVGVGAVGIALCVGILIGAAAGYRGGWLDQLLMRLVDILLCFPTIFLILAMVAFVGPSVLNLIVIIGATGWMDVARLVRAEVLTLKERDFIYAARAMGASTGWILLRHLVPNAMPPVIVSATLGTAGAILVESGLSFLGIGVQPPIASWGNILSEGKATLGVGWWLTAAPGLAIFAVVLGLHLTGEGLRRRFRI